MGQGTQDQRLNQRWYAGRRAFGSGALPPFCGAISLTLLNRSVGRVVGHAEGWGVSGARAGVLSTVL